jgi:hypothetical protein
MFSEDMILIGLALTKMPKKIKRSKWVKNWLERPKRSHTNILNKMWLQPTDWHSYLRIRFELALNAHFIFFCRILRATYVLQATHVQLDDFGEGIHEARIACQSTRQ